MKPQRDTLAIVTATTDPLRAKPCFESWVRLARYHYPTYVVWSVLPGAPADAALDKAQAEALRCFLPGLTTPMREGGGVVPAFALGVEQAFQDGAQAVLCLHDDVDILEQDWDRWLGVDRLPLRDRTLDQTYYTHFAGFGGAKTLGAADIYRTPYDPMQLARGGFCSNLRDAEQHGRRTHGMERCCVFDGFSQLGTAEWFRDAWKWLADSGIQHHAYDAALGCLAARAKVQGWVLPVWCHHRGGQTAVADQYYHQWAKTQDPEGDQGFWTKAHQVVYDEFRDVLPLGVR